MKSTDIIYRYDGAIFFGFSIELEMEGIDAVDEFDELIEKVQNIHEDLILISSSIEEDTAILGIPVQPLSPFEIIPIDMDSLNHYNENTDLRKDSTKLVQKARDHIESLELQYIRIDFVNSEPNLLAFMYDS